MAVSRMTISLQRKASSNQFLSVEKVANELDVGIPKVGSLLVVDVLHRLQIDARQIPLSVWMHSTPILPEGILDNRKPNQV